MKITTKAHYGLMAMCELAQHYNRRLMSVREIAERQSCSDSYMEQLFALLKKAGLIESSRGSRGGYTLVKDPEEISIAEIIRALEGPIGFTDCSIEGVDKEKCQLHETCCSQEFWQDFTDTINSFLESRKLADLVH